MILHFPSNGPNTDMENALPYQLFRVVLISSTIGGLFVVIPVVLAVSTHRREFLSLMLVGLYFIARAIMIYIKWKHGLIVPMVIHCVALSQRRNSLCVSGYPVVDGILDTSSLPMELMLSNKTTGIQINSTILAFIDGSLPHTPITWELVLSPLGQDEHIP